MEEEKVNGYSCLVSQWTDAKLLAECRKLEEKCKYSGPANDGYWLYLAVLEELKNRGLK